MKIDLDVFRTYTELNGFCLHKDGVKDIKRTQYFEKVGSSRILEIVREAKRAAVSPLKFLTRSRKTATIAKIRRVLTDLLAGLLGKFWIIVAKFKWC